MNIVRVHDLCEDKENVDDSQMNSIDVCENYCAIGSNDGCLRLWSLSFKEAHLQAEHQGGISVVSISKDGTKVLAGTCEGNMGFIDIREKIYQTITRSHVGDVISFFINTTSQQLATISTDCSLKVWDLDSYRQIYDFHSIQDAPTSVSWRPQFAEIVCGFESGSVRVFDLPGTKLKYELSTGHSKKVYSVLFDPLGVHMYSTSADGSLIQYDVHNSYNVLRSLNNVIHTDATLPGYSTTIDDKGHRLAVIGPTQVLVTIFNCKSLDEILHIDVTNFVKESKQTSYRVDKAVGIQFAPTAVHSHLIVVTEKSRMLKFDSKTGQLLFEIFNIHNGTPSSFCCCPRGQFIATSGDNCIKVWDYQMTISQVFIGHSSKIGKLQFTNDCRKLISVGDMICIWDFLPFFQREDDTRNMIQTKKVINLDDSSILPRTKEPQPSPYIIPTNDLNVEHDITESEENSILLSFDKNELDTTESNELVEEGDQNLSQPDYSDDVQLENEIQKETTPDKIIGQTVHHAAPNIHAHFQATTKQPLLSRRIYAAPSNEEGMHLTSIVGTSSNAKNAVVWHSDTGLFMYTQRCYLIKEDLSTGKQDLLYNSVDEISTLALQWDGKVIAVGSAFDPVTKYGPIIIWDLTNGKIKKTLEHHNCSVIGLEYSRDDRYLLSIGDYHECSIVIWCAQEYIVLTQTILEIPIHVCRWNAYSSNEFVTVGRGKSICFWTLNDDPDNEIEIKRVVAEVPEAAFNKKEHHNDVTAVVYCSKDLLLTATCSGVVCGWSIKDKRCYMHWQADKNEIDVIVYGYGKVLTGSTSNKLCLWSLPTLEKILTNNNGVESTNGVVMENEMTLDGALTSAMFDESLEMGVVGTSNGSIWYVNISQENTDCTRIVNGHHKKINDMAICTGNDNYIATACADGTLKLWSMQTRQQAAQFQVLSQECTCVSFCSQYSVDDEIVNEKLDYAETRIPMRNAEEHPSQCIAGYSDGSIRMFDFGKMKLLFKIKPHSGRVTTISSSFDGRVAMSGCVDGTIVIFSMLTSMTMRVINEHKGSTICNISQQQESYHLSCSTWLASSMDCRISLWKSDWSKDSCQLDDWITFSRPNFSHDKIDGMEEQPCIAIFSQVDKDMLIYTGHGLFEEIAFYSLSKKKVIKSIPCHHLVLSLHISQCGNLLAAGCQDRLIQLIDSQTGSFQEFHGHSNSINHLRFLKNGKELISISQNELFIWNTVL